MRGPLGAQIKAMDSMRDTVARMQAPLGTRGFPHAPDFLNFEQYKAIGREALMNTGLGFATIAIVIFVLVASPLDALLTFLSVSSAPGAHWVHVPQWHMHRQRGSGTLGLVIGARGALQRACGAWISGDMGRALDAEAAAKDGGVMLTVFPAAATAVAGYVYVFHLMLLYCASRAAAPACSSPPGSRCRQAPNSAEHDDVSREVWSCRKQEPKHRLEQACE